MNYRLGVKESLDKRFKKLSKEDKEMLRLIHQKVQDILEDPHRFKPLRGSLQDAVPLYHTGGQEMTISVHHSPDPPLSAMKTSLHVPAVVMILRAKTAL